jgi:hypothetical protein
MCEYPADLACALGIAVVRDMVKRRDGEYLAEVPVSKAQSPAVFNLDVESIGGKTLYGLQTCLPAWR